MHNLEKEEWNELAEIQYKLLKAINEELEITKEYIACFAEMEGFKHIHFHVIPKTKEYNEENKGTKEFQYLKIEDDKRINDNEIKNICKSINLKMKN